MNKREEIIKHTIKLFALSSVEGVSMRALARDTGIAQSVIYHYFPNKDALLRAMFDETNTQLGIARANTPIVKTASEMLRIRIEFQLDHAEEIVAVLKYYVLFRATFHKSGSGFVPPKAYLHIQEVLELGNKTGEFKVDNIDEDAKVITHAINGFLLEFYPQIPSGKERNALVNSMHKFLMKALTNKGAEK